MSLIAGLITRAHRNCLLAFLAFDITAPDIPAFTALLDFPLKCLMPAPATHVSATSLPSSRGIAFPTRSAKSPSGLALSAVVRRRVQGDEVPRSVTFSSSGSEHLLITALELADHVDDVVVLFLEERSHVFELAQAPEAGFRLART